MKILLILSDGTRPDSLEGIEFIEKLKRESTYCMAAQTVMPSVTLPCHMSLFHSVDPSRHGTTTNTYAPQVRPISGLFEQLKAANPQEAWINPVDAEERGIAQGDTIRVKNQFGEIELLAKVTGRTTPGVVCISQGAWHDADMNGDRVDKGGSINTLTTLRPSPLAKGNPQHTNICQVTKA